MTDLNTTETYEILEISRPDEMANLTTLYDFLEDNEELMEYFFAGVQEHYNNAQHPAQNASDFLCDSEPLDISDVECYMESEKIGFPDNQSVNDNFDNFMEESYPNVTEENDVEYSGQYYIDYKDMLFVNGDIHKLQNDQYTY